MASREIDRLADFALTMNQKKNRKREESGERTMFLALGASKTAFNPGSCSKNFT